MTGLPDIGVRVAAWAEAGIITADQAERIARFERNATAVAGSAAAAASPTAPAPSAASPDGVGAKDRAAGILGTLGGLLVGLGVLLTVAANWESIADTTKLVVIVVSMVVAFGLGIFSDVRSTARWPGTAAYTVGVLIFGAGLFLLGQTYNVQAHDPVAFLLLALAASAVAVLTGRRMVGWIAGTAWLAWATYETAFALDTTTSDSEGIAVLAVLALVACAALATGWVLDGVSVRAKQGSGNDRPLAADLNALGGPFRGVALTVLLGLLIPASYGWHVESSEIEAASGMSIWVTASFALAAIAAGLASRISELRLKTAVSAAIAGGAFFIYVASLIQDPVLVAVVANLLLGVGGIGLAVLGLSEDRRNDYAWGVVWVISLIAARYFDAMVTTDLGGVGFIGAGLLLLGCAWLVARSRRVWLERGRA